MENAADNAAVRRSKSLSCNPPFVPRGAVARPAKVAMSSSKQLDMLRPNREPKRHRFLLWGLNPSWIIFWWIDWWNGRNFSQNYAVSTGYAINSIPARPRISR